MNPNYNRDITLYNCIRAPDSPDRKEVWYRHVLHNCFYKNVIGRVEKGNGLQMASAYTVRIPESDLFKSYEEWRLLSEEERAQYFTLRTDDLVIGGICQEEISGIGMNAASQILNRMKPDAFRITAISINTGSLEGRHYRIGG